MMAWPNGGKIGKIRNTIGEPFSAKEEKDSRATQPPLSGSTEIQAHRFAPLVSATTGPGSTGPEDVKRQYGVSYVLDQGRQ
ncbi:hypothetical protein N7478_005477 [Penicillium angulare]|uniref:uncharacterized protein n=1 Tax=Penicillium angulare TaxID=116970 RepID=UPI0025415493|nr:uncharacterized protein N7478_005477 [Penicillium angulare]KAJ5280105.1 hypothetical protein N7478_005477 [Penicillium angulare]